MTLGLYIKRIYTKYVYTTGAKTGNSRADKRREIAGRYAHTQQHSKSLCISRTDSKIYTGVQVGHNTLSSFDDLPCFEDMKHKRVEL